MEFIKYDYYVETRGNKTLYLFPDKPFWFIADISLKLILDYYSGKVTLEEIRCTLSGQFSYSFEEVDEAVKVVHSILQNADLFVKKEESSSERLMAVKDRFAIPVLNVTKKCNLYCRHCYANASYTPSYSLGDDLSTDEWKKVIDEVGRLLSDIGDDRVLLTGGEPFLREDIMELVEHIFMRGYRPFINTNSLLISDDQMKGLKKYQAELLVSLDGSSPEVHEYLRGENTFDRTITQIRKLRDAGVITKLSYTVHDKNLHDIEGFLKIAQELDVKSVTINNLTILHRAESTGVNRVNTWELNSLLDSLAVKSKKYFEYISKTDYANMGAILLANVKFIYCGVGAASLCIDSNGDIYPCYNTLLEEFKLGNVKKDDLMQIWSSAALLEDLRNLSVDTMNRQCSKCIVRYYCGGGCRGESYYNFGNIKAPYPYCKDMKKTILDTMFILSESRAIFEKTAQAYHDLKNKFIREFQKKGYQE